MATQTGSIDLRGVKQSYESVEVGGRNLIRRTDYTKYDSIWVNGGSATFDSDRVTVPYAKEVYQSPYTEQVINEIIPSGTLIMCSVYIYEQSVPDGNHRIYIAPINSADTPNWNVNIKVIPQGFTGMLTWQFTTTFDTYGFTIDLDTRNGTSGQIVFGLVKAEKGNKATTWTPAPEDVQENIDAAQDTADVAQNAAEDAARSAAAASQSAIAAQNSANEVRADVNDLSLLVGASSWATGHGIYNKSTDTTVDISKEYYTVSAEVVSNPTGSPHKGLYYELSNGTYILTPDDVVVSGKTYYILTPTLVDEPSGNPSTSGYYERSLNESIEEYLSAHISMNANGLFVTDGSTSQVQISSTGVSIWNGDKQLANYGSIAQIGAIDDFHILIGGEDNEIGFYQGGDNKVAYINGQALYVENSLSFGKEDSEHDSFIFYQRANGHFTLKLSREVS